jgi:hypothetical protein
MKRIFTLCIALCTIMNCFAQTDTTGKQNQAPQGDTIHIGGMIIIRKAGNKTTQVTHVNEFRDTSVHIVKHSRISTNWAILDLGFSNYSDKTIYSSAAAQGYAPGSNKGWFALKNGKSRNVNIWLFMQKLSVSKRILNLKYGLGLELNNYYFKQPIRYNAHPSASLNPPRVFYDTTTGRVYKKNKLAADYFTVPMMVNINFTPKRKEGFGFSAGISLGYLYGSRNKTVTSDESKKKTKDDFELEKWKLSYIAELSLGSLRFYGSYAFKNMYQRGLDITPYNFGIRFSNW